MLCCNASCVFPINIRAHLNFSSNQPALSSLRYAGIEKLLAWDVQEIINRGLQIQDLLPVVRGLIHFVLVAVD